MWKVIEPHNTEVQSRAVSSVLEREIVSETAQVRFYRGAHLHDDIDKVIAPRSAGQIGVDHSIEDVQKAGEFVESVPRVLRRSIVAEEELSAQRAGFVRLLASSTFTIHQHRSQVEARLRLVVGHRFLQGVHVDVTCAVL